jgi:hypothetical protein
MGEVTIISPEGSVSTIKVQNKTAVLPDGAKLDDHGNPLPAVVHWETARTDTIAAGADKRTYDLSATQRIIIEGK